MSSVPIHHVQRAELRYVVARVTHYAPEYTIKHPIVIINMMAIVLPAGSGTRVNHSRRTHRSGMVDDARKPILRHRFEQLRLAHALLTAEEHVEAECMVGDNVFPANLGDTATRQNE